MDLIHKENIEWLFRFDVSESLIYRSIESYFTDSSVIYVPYPVVVNIYYVSLNDLY